MEGVLGAEGRSPCGERLGRALLIKGARRLYNAAGGARVSVHSFTVRKRRALLITLTDDSAIAAAAMAGDSNRPKVG